MMVIPPQYTRRSGLLVEAIVVVLIHSCCGNKADLPDPLPSCDSLLVFQFECQHPPSPWPDNQVEGCRPNNTILVNCSAHTGVECNGSRNFFREAPCRYTNGYKYATALALSIFFGNFGADRFYLGYPVMGVLKLCTCGFFVIGNLVDITLIATQGLGPADGSLLEVSQGLPVIAPWKVSCRTQLDIKSLANEEWDMRELR